MKFIFNREKKILKRNLKIIICLTEDLDYDNFNFKSLWCRVIVDYYKYLGFELSTKPNPGLQCYHLTDSTLKKEY